MQNQRNRTEVQSVTAAQSLAAVQTLLKAGLGCIAFMRDLLPHDNFTESHFVTSDETPASSSSGSIDLRQKQPSISGFKIMTMSRGYTDEADRLLNYLEFGVFEALERQYLRSFIFAIYLDSKDPNNLVEAYTFNFHYYKVPGTNATVPVMTMDASGKGSAKQRKAKDPVAEAVCKGQVPTLRDVKRGVKNLLKCLITSMTQMDVLPKRRFATFKMFYTDDTPDEYQPPHFQAADADKDKWYFMTHDFNERPDQWSIGKLDTGHHGIDVKVTSVATYLPSATELENAPFNAFTNTTRVAPALLTPAEETAIREEQVLKQTEDAEVRNVVWPSDEPHDVEAAFPDNGDGFAVTKELMPLGVRDKDGNIQAIPGDAMVVDEEIVYGGATQSTPKYLSDTIDDIGDIHMLAATQAVDQTPTPADLSVYPHASSSLPDHLNFQPSSPCPQSSAVEDIDTQMLQKLVLSNDAADDAEMLDMETQRLPASSLPPESIGSFGMETPTPRPKREAIQVENTLKQRRNKENDDIVECECGISLEDGCTYCEGGCRRWLHVWCGGYHSTADERLPDNLVCFDCRLRADPSWELIKVNHYATIIGKYRDLAMFRRAIKIAERDNPENLTRFTKAMGCEVSAGKQLFRRLELENFIVEQELVTDAMGVTEARVKTRGKGKGGKAAKARRNAQKTRHVFNYASKHSREYLNYFNPDPAVENQVLGLTNLHDFGRRRSHHDSQTQYEETQAGDKRTRNDTGPRKRIKVSMAPPIDLAE